VRVEPGLRRVGVADAGRVRGEDVLGGLLEQLRVSSALSSMPFSRAAEMTSAAAPPALPVFVDPVEPSMEIDDLPPNCAVFALRKYVCGGALVPGSRGPS
jgi:hypothetical protein